MDKKFAKEQAVGIIFAQKCKIVELESELSRLRKQPKWDREGLVKIIEAEIMPYRDMEDRTDKFKFDERVMKIFSKNIANAILAGQKEGV